MTDLYKSAAVSAVFLLYLVNTPGKNEFKIAWILPVILAPFFGISLYFMYKFNQGGINLKKKLRKLRADTKDYIPPKRDARAVAEYFPEVKDIAQYLYNFGDATGYLDSETQYFSCGEDFFADLIDELKKAERYIFIEFFIVEPCQILDKDGSADVHEALGAGHSPQFDLPEKFAECVKRDLR